jgi:hypothetical protein
LKKIFLSVFEKERTNKELSKKYSVSITTIITAKKRGWFLQNHTESHFKDIKLPPKQKTKFKNLIHLSDDDRRLSISEVVRKFNISRAVASKARIRGWIANKLGRSTNIIETGGLPKNVTVDDLIGDAEIGAKRVRKRFDLKIQELDDIQQVGLVRLLELTAESGFSNPRWRKKVAYWTGIRYAVSQIIKINSKFGYELDKFENNLSDKKIFLKTMENHIDFKDIMNKLSPAERSVVANWIIVGNNKPTKKVIKILESIKSR